MVLKSYDFDRPIRIVSCLRIFDKYIRSVHLLINSLKTFKDITNLFDPTITVRMYTVFAVVSNPNFAQPSFHYLHLSL